MARSWTRLALMGLVLGCVATSARAEDTLTLWHAYAGAEATALGEAVHAFEREHPGVRVELLSLPFGAYASKLEAAIPAGRGPDVFIDAHERLPQYLERGLLDAYGDGGDLTVFAPAQLEVLRQNGQLYGMPLAVKCAALYVNTRLANDAQLASFDDIAALRASLPRDTYPLVFEADNPYYLAALLSAEGASLITQKGEYGFVGPGAVSTLALLQHWSKARVLPEEPSPDLTKRLFHAGKAATMIGGPWLAVDLPEALAWKVIPLPPLSRGGRAVSPFVTIEVAYLAHHAEHPPEHAQLVRELVDQLAHGDGARVRARVGGQVVAANVANLAGSPWLEVFRSAAMLGTPMSVHPHMRRVWEPAQRAAKKALRGDGEIQNALLEGKRRFDDAVRPLPEARSPTPLLLGLGALFLYAAVALVRRTSDVTFRRRVRASLPAYAYVTHAFLVLLLLVVGPLVIGALTSFFAGRGRDLYYVGLANYVDILSARGGELWTPGSFWLVLVVTLLWTVGNLVLHVTLGVSIALLLARVTGTVSKLYRVLLILPWAVPSYVTALAWKGMFHRQFGAINALLTLLGVSPVSWFAKFSTAFSANLATNTWLGFPFMMVVTLGALAAIPRELYEAAAVDGAGPLHKLRFITLPMIRPVLAPAVAMGAVWTFNMFNVIFLVSGGEPDGSTEILVSEAYRWAFTRSSQYGYAAAYAVLIFGLLWLGTRVLGPQAAENRA